MPSGKAVKRPFKKQEAAVTLAWSCFETLRKIFLSLFERWYFEVLYFEKSTDINLWSLPCMSFCFLLHILQPCTCCSPLLRVSSSVCFPRARILLRLQASLLPVGCSFDLSSFSCFTSSSACVGILVFIEKKTELQRTRPPSLRPDGQFQSVLDDKASIIFPVGHSSHISLGVRKDENSTCT